MRKLILIFLVVLATTIKAQDACYNCAYKLNYQINDSTDDMISGFVNRFFTCIQDCIANTWSDCVEQHWKCVADSDKSRGQLKDCFTKYEKCWEEERKKNTQ